MTIKGYFLPKGLEDGLAHESAEGISTTPETLWIEGFGIPGYILSGEATAIERFIAEAPIHRGMMQRALASMREYIAKDTPEKPAGTLKDCGTGKIRGDEYTLLSVEPSVLHLIFECGDKRHQVPGLSRDITFSLQKFASYIGREISFASPELSSFRPYPMKSDELMVILDASPPGEATRLSHGKLGGTWLTENGEPIDRAGPARGYGTIVKDRDGEIAAQIIDNTIYIFLPVHSRSRIQIMSTGARVFNETLALAWNAYIAGTMQEHSREEIQSAERYATLVELHAELLPLSASEQLREIEKELENLSARYRQLLAAKAKAIRTQEDAVAHCSGLDHAALLRDWDRISALPGISCAYISDDGLHVELPPMRMEQDGVEYQLGSFVIRFGPCGMGIWSPDPTHPHGQAHPHIGDSGKPCFGNIGLAVQAALFELRYADALEMIIRWLAEGYSPALALSKIDTWPLVKKTETEVV